MIVFRSVDVVTRKIILFKRKKKFIKLTAVQFLIKNAPSQLCDKQKHHMLETDEKMMPNQNILSLFCFGLPVCPRGSLKKTVTVLQLKTQKHQLKRHDKRRTHLPLLLMKMDMFQMEGSLPQGKTRNVIIFCK